MILSYVIYNPQFWRRDEHLPFEVYKLVNSAYELQIGEPFWMPEIGLGIGRCRLPDDPLEREILSWYDAKGDRYPNEAGQRLYDVGSGLNFKRKGLQTILVRFMRGEQLTIVVACRDRLCRFGFELFEFMAEQNGGSIVVLDRTVYCPEAELTNDRDILSG